MVNILTFTLRKPVQSWVIKEPTDECLWICQTWAGYDGTERRIAHYSNVRKKLLVLRFRHTCFGLLMHIRGGLAQLVSSASCQRVVGHKHS